MLSIIIQVLVLAVTIVLLVGIHEFGHYWMAKQFSLPVEKLVISPLGGFIKFRSDFVLDSVAKYKRACIFLAGPVFNILFAILAYWCVFFIGVKQPVPVIGSVTPHSLAADVGLSANSKIMAVDGIETHTWMAVIFRVLPHLGKSDVLTIQTEKNKFNIQLKNFTLDPLKPNLLLSLGIIPEKINASNIVLRKFSALLAFPEAFKEVKLYFYMNMIVIQEMITGNISLRSLVGPIGLLSSSWVVAQQGIIPYVAFLGFISVGLAFINLLPLPGLDGGHLLYLVIELFRGRPLSSALQMLLLRLGIILLTVLMIQVLMNDLSRLY